MEERVCITFSGQVQWGRLNITERPGVRCSSNKETRERDFVHGRDVRIWQIWCQWKRNRRGQMLKRKSLLNEEERPRIEFGDELVPENPPHSENDAGGRYECGVVGAPEINSRLR